MKKLTLPTCIVLAIAIGIGLVFSWVYPFVTLTPGLAVVFVILAVIINAIGRWIFKKAFNRHSDVEPEA